MEIHTYVRSGESIFPNKQITTPLNVTVTAPFPCNTHSFLSHSVYYFLR